MLLHSSSGMVLRLVLLSSVLGAIAWHGLTWREASATLGLIHSESVRSSERIAIRNTPLEIAPPGDLGEMITDERLKVILTDATPRWSPPNVPMMLHAVRLWGPLADFSDESGERAEMSCHRFVQIMLDNEQFREQVGSFDNFLVETSFGVRVLSSGDPGEYTAYAEGHYDQLLQCFGEAGVAASTPVVTDSGKTFSLREIVSDSLMRFSLSQELEFTTCAYVRWLPPARRWKNRFGESYSFDDLALALAERELGSGACQGCHVPYALANLMRASELYPGLLSKDAQRAVRERLREVSLCLEAHELNTGGWDKSWSGEYVERPENLFFELKPHFDRIASTGHHLEWIALVSGDMRPSRSVIARAASALIREIASLSEADRSKFKGFLPVSHAARAFVLMRGSTNGAQVWDALAGTDSGSPAGAEP